MTIQLGWRYGRFSRTLSACLAATLWLGISSATAESRTKLVMEEYFLHGEPADQLSRAALEESPTFTQDPPGGMIPAVQVSAGLAAHSAGQTVHSGEGHHLLARWSGEFLGRLEGNVSLTAWVNGVPISFAKVAVYADGERIDVGDTKRNGQSQNGWAVLDVGPEGPRKNTLTVAVAGDVEGALSIEVHVPAFALSGTSPVRDMMVWYGSSDMPSGLELPTIVPCDEEDPHPDCQDE